MYNKFTIFVCCMFFLLQIERPLQKHGGRLEHDEKYCGSCFGAEEVHLIVFIVVKFALVFLLFCN